MKIIIAKKLIQKIFSRNVLCIFAYRISILFEYFSVVINRIGFQISVNNKIRLIHSRLPKYQKIIDKKIIEKHLLLWKPLKKKINTKWIEAYINISDILSEKYIPEDIYYSIVEPLLNNYEMMRPFENKNYYHKFFADYRIHFPQTILSNIDGTYYDSEYNPVKITDTKLNEILKNHGKVIIKPTINSSGGRNVDLLLKNQHGHMNSEGVLVSLSLLENIVTTQANGVKSH